jgi:hypothetical protein
MGDLPMAAQTLWTEQKLSVVQHLLVTEGLTRAAIAERVGVSTFAVIHAIQRYHLRPQPHHGTPAKPSAKPQCTFAFRNGAPIPPGSAARDLPIESSPRAVTLMQSTADSCMWPIGNNLFCGRMRSNRIPKASYCRRHHARAYPVKTGVSQAREDSNELLAAHCLTL